VSKLGNDLKWNLRAPECLTGLINEGYGGIAKETRGLMDMRDAIGLKAHQPGAGCIGSNRIICENDDRKKSHVAGRQAIFYGSIADGSCFSPSA
jgi:hypothetical protein